MKKCSTCKAKKPFSDFYKNRRNNDGLMYECKQCHRERKIRNAGNVTRSKKRCCTCKKEKLIDEFCKNKLTSDGHSARCKKCGLERMKEYRKTEKGKVVDRRAAMKYHYTKRGQEVYKKAQARYKKSKKGQIAIRAGWRRRRALVAGSEGEFTENEWVSLCKQYDSRCCACGKKTKLEADHVIPIVMGGVSYISNIQPLCRSCNAKKSIKTTDYRTKPGLPYWTQRKLL